MRTSGKTVMVCEYKDKYTPAEFEVVEQDVPNILGLHTCIEMKMVKRIDSMHPAQTGR